MHGKIAHGVGQRQTVRWSDCYVRQQIRRDMRRAGRFFTGKREYLCLFLEMELNVFECVRFQVLEI